MVYNDGVDDYGHPAGIAKVFKNTLVRRLRQERQKRDYASIFEEICEPVTSDVFDKEQLRMDCIKEEFPKRKK